MHFDRFTLACMLNCFLWSVAGIWEMEDFNVYFPNILGLLSSIAQFALKLMYGDGKGIKGEEKMLPLWTIWLQVNSLVRGVDSDHPTVLVFGKVTIIVLCRHSSDTVSTIVNHLEKKVHIIISSFVVSHMYNQTIMIRTTNYNFPVKSTTPESSSNVTPFIFAFTKSEIIINLLFNLQYVACFKVIFLVD